MLRLTYPTKDSARIAFLQSVVHAHEQDERNVRRRLKKSTVERAAALLEHFSTLHQTVNTRKAELSTLRQRLDSGVRLLRGALSSLWNDVRTEVAAGQANTGLYTYYGLSQQGSSSSRSSNREVLVSLASEVLAGHWNAQAQPELPRFDATRLEQTLSEVRTALEAQKEALDARQAAQEARRPLRREIALLALTISQELRSTLVHESAHYRREIMRKYGFTFRRVGPDGKLLPEPAVETPQETAEETAEETPQAATEETPQEPTQETAQEPADESAHSFAVPADPPPAAPPAALEDKTMPPTEFVVEPEDQPTEE